MVDHLAGAASMLHSLAVMSLAVVSPALPSGAEGPSAPLAHDAQDPVQTQNVSARRHLNQIGYLQHAGSPPYVSYATGRHVANGIEYYFRFYRAADFLPHDCVFVDPEYKSPGLFNFEAHSTQFIEAFKDACRPDSSGTCGNWQDIKSSIDCACGDYCQTNANKNWVQVTVYGGNPTYVSYCDNAQLHGLFCWKDSVSPSPPPLPHPPPLSPLLGWSAENFCYDLAGEVSHDDVFAYVRGGQNCGTHKYCNTSDGSAPHRELGVNDARECARRCLYRTLSMSYMRRTNPSLQSLQCKHFIFAPAEPPDYQCILCDEGDVIDAQLHSAQRYYIDYSEPPPSPPPALPPPPRARRRPFENCPTTARSCAVSSTPTTTSSLATG